MLNKDYIVYALIAVGIFTVYMAIMHLFRTDAFKGRVQGAADASFLAGLDAEEKVPAFSRFCERALAAININAGNQREISASLARAGIESPYAIVHFLFFKNIVQPILLLAGAVYAVVAIASAKPGAAALVLFNLMAAMMIIIIGVMGARLYVANRKQKRQQVLLESFPEMLDLLLVCIESGLGLDAALNRVCKELRDTHPAISSELDRTRLELNMLNDRTQALSNLAERTEIVPIKSLVASLIQTEKFGTSLVDTLRVLSEEQRLARLYGAEQKAARIPVLITIPLILFIMPAFVMILVAPPVVRVIETGGLFTLSAPAKK